MKKNLGILAFAAAFVFAACDSGGGGGEQQLPVDDPGKGEMTAATAAKIFETSQVEGGVQIDKFKDANALRAYIDAGGPARSPSGPMRAPGDKTLVLNKIAGVYIVSIAEYAFNSAVGDAAKLTGFNVKLPEKLTTIYEHSFTGAGIVMLLVPETVETALASVLDDIETNSGAAVLAVAGEEEDAPFLGDGIFVKADGKTLYINTTVYDSNGVNPLNDGKKFVSVWDRDPWENGAVEGLAAAEYIDGGTLHIPDIPLPALRTEDFGSAAVTPPNLQITVLRLFAGQDTPGDGTEIKFMKGDNRADIMYADSDGSIIGGEFNDVRLRKGWNFVIVNDVNDEEAIVKNGSAEGFRWRYPISD